VEFKREQDTYWEDYLKGGGIERIKEGIVVCSLTLK